MKTIQTICHLCIGDDHLKSQIRELNRYSVCSICGTNNQTIDVEILAKQISEIIADNFNSDYVVRTRGGHLLKSVVQSIVKSKHKATDAIVDILVDTISTGRGKLDIETLFDREIHYHETLTSNVMHYKVWPEFSNGVKYLSRFFNAKAKEVLDDIFMDNEVISSPKKAKPIVTIVPNSTASFYRGRIATTNEQINSYLKHPRQELGPIHPRMAKPGRMNPQGISMMYLSFNKKTCIAELRPPVGSTVITAGFVLLRPIQVLDISILSKGMKPKSYFDPDLLKIKDKIAFLSTIESEMTKPVFVGNELIDYLPTQVIAEYLNVFFRPKLDGIILHSAQSNGKNLVLFPEITHEYIRTFSLNDLKGTSQPTIEWDQKPLEIESIVEVSYKLKTRNMKWIRNVYPT